MFFLGILLMLVGAGMMLYCLLMALRSGTSEGIFIAVLIAGILGGGLSQFGGKLMGFHESAFLHLKVVQIIHCLLMCLLIPAIFFSLTSNKTTGLALAIILTIILALVVGAYDFSKPPFPNLKLFGSLYHSGPF